MRYFILTYKGCPKSMAVRDYLNIIFNHCSILWLLFVKLKLSEVVAIKMIEKRNSRIDKTWYF